MIFFGEMFDQHEHWSDFFNEHNISQARNIYLLHPRNFGNSDRHDSFDVEDMADDVVRFMDKRGIKQATLAGHGFGGKMALAVGCYHSTRVTGVCVLDSGPLDHRHYQPH
jgi:pimeloyl-ACP methyl ester carboxylesterase